MGRVISPRQTVRLSGGTTTATMRSGELLLALTAWWVGPRSAVAHVPGYGGSCEFNCCHPPYPKEPDVSQVTYIEGTGGIEIDKVDLQPLIDKGTPIEFSVVFREEYDPTTFQVFVGCGGCASDKAKQGYNMDEGNLDGPQGWDPVNFTTNLVPVPMTYQPGKLEPFTQTAYFALLPPGPQRFYDTTELRECESDHWSLRIITYDNSTVPFLWGAVLGCEDSIECERFYFGELFRFPIYVASNHGRAWNRVGWSLPVIAITVAVIFGLLLYFGNLQWGWYLLYVPVSILQPQRIYDLVCTQGRRRPALVQLPCVSWEPSIRCAIYAIVIYALIVDLFETMTHYFIAMNYISKSTVGADPEGLGQGLFWGVVFFFGKVAPIVIVSFIWFYHRAIPEFVWRTYRFRCGCGWYSGLGFYSPMWAHGAWSIVEILFMGFLGLIWLGAGYWVMPFGLLISGTVRAINWVLNPRRYMKGVQYEYPTARRMWGGVDNGGCSEATKQELLRIYAEYYDDSFFYQNRNQPTRRPSVSEAPPPPPQQPPSDSQTQPLLSAPPEYKDAVAEPLGPERYPAPLREPDSELDLKDTEEAALTRRDSSGRFSARLPSLTRLSS